MAGVRPTRSGQRARREDDERARGGLAGARRRSRGPRHREHGRGNELPDRARRRRARPRQGGDERAVAPHPRRRAALHRLAQPCLDAGHRRGPRQLRRWRPPLRRRRRRRDRRERRHLLRHPRVARAGDVVRGCRPVAQDGVRAHHAHGVGRAVRAHARGQRVAARHGVADRRPARAAARGGAGAGGEDRPELASGDAGDEAGVVGCVGARAHRRVPCRRARSSSGCGATPTRRKGRWRSPSGERPAGR